MLLNRPVSQHVGKIVDSISSDSLGGTSLVMCNVATITFTDGTSITLKRDWRGGECYISEYQSDSYSSLETRFATSIEEREACAGGCAMCTAGPTKLGMEQKMSKGDIFVFGFLVGAIIAFLFIRVLLMVD